MLLERWPYAAVIQQPYLHFELYHQPRIWNIPKRFGQQPCSCCATLPKKEANSVRRSAEAPIRLDAIAASVGPAMVYPCRSYPSDRIRQIVSADSIWQIASSR